MKHSWMLDIAGCCCPLTDPEGILSDLGCVYEAFQRRAEAYRADPRNPHLCRAGCSHCCERGAFFAVTLAEALMLALAVEALSRGHRQQVLGSAQALLRLQHEVFAQVHGPPDVPGCRDEELVARAPVARCCISSCAASTIVGLSCVAPMVSPLMRTPSKPTR
jgi:hypothetical protein